MAGVGSLLESLAGSVGKQVEQIINPVTTTVASARPTTSSSATQSTAGIVSARSSSAARVSTPTSASVPATLSTAAPTTSVAAAPTATSGVTNSKAAASISSSLRSLTRDDSPSSTLSLAAAAETSSAGASESSSESGSSTSPGLIAGIIFALIVGAALVGFAFIVQRRRRLTAERIRVAQNQMANFKGYDKGNDRRGNFSLSPNLALGINDADSRYPKSYVNLQSPEPDFELRKNTRATGHDFIPDYPPTMYREHSVDLAKGEYNVESPVEGIPPTYLQQFHAHGDERPGAQSNHGYHNENTPEAHFAPPDVTRTQSIIGFDPYNTEATETYPSTPSHIHGSYIDYSDSIASPIEYTTQYSTGLTYLTTQRSPYSVSSCSQTTGDTEEATNSESETDENESPVRPPNNFASLRMHPLTVDLGEPISPSRVARASEDTVVPRMISFPGSR